MSGPTKKREKIDLPALRGRLVVDTWRGQLRVRSWPRKRGLSSSIPVRNQQEWFRAVAHLIKYAPPSQVIAAMQATKGSGLYPRDLLMRAVAGGFFDLVLEDGQVIRQRSPQLEAKMFIGARLERTTNLAITGGVVVPITWPLPVIDTTAFFSAGAPSRLTIPANVSIVELKGALRFATANNGLGRLLIRKNGSTFLAETAEANVSNPVIQGETGPIPVAEGDYFELTALLAAGNTLSGIPSTYFTLTVLQAGA